MSLALETPRHLYRRDVATETFPTAPQRLDKDVRSLTCCTEVSAVSKAVFNSLFNLCQLSCQVHILVHYREAIYTMCTHEAKTMSQLLFELYKEKRYIS